MLDGGETGVGNGTEPSGTWRAERIGGRDVGAVTESTVTFLEDGKVEGHGGVNRFAGAYVLAEGTIEMGPFRSTRMAGPEPAMRQEADFLSSLTGRSPFVIEDAKLVIGEGAQQVRLRRVEGSSVTGSASQTANLQELGSVAPKHIWEGVAARIVQGDRITMAVVELEPGRDVPEHAHDNEQLGFVIAGSVTFTVGDETKHFGPGGTWRILGGVPHSARGGQDGAVVVDVFSPPRADWDDRETEAPRPPRWPS